MTALALVYLGIYEIQHVNNDEQVSKKNMLQILITGTIGPVPIYKNGLAPI